MTIDGATTQKADNPSRRKVMQKKRKNNHYATSKISRYVIKHKMGGGKITLSEGNNWEFKRKRGELKGRSFQQRHGFSGKPEKTHEC